MLNQAQSAPYTTFWNKQNIVLANMAEAPAHVIWACLKSPDPEASVQALFDFVMDAGHRMLLVKVLDIPSIPGWVRQKLEVFLYGKRQGQPALFRVPIH